MHGLNPTKEDKMENKRVVIECRRGDKKYRAIVEERELDEELVPWVMTLSYDPKEIGTYTEDGEKWEGVGTRWRVGNSAVPWAPEKRDSFEDAVMYYAHLATTPRGWW